MQLGSFNTPQCIIYKARIYLRDKVEGSWATDGRLWKDWDLTELANDAQRLIVGILASSKFAESLGDLYRGQVFDVNIGDSNFLFSTLGVSPEQITGVKVRYSTTGDYVIAKPLSPEGSQALEAFSGTKTSPRYTILTMPDYYERVLSVLPAFDADVPSGLVVWSVESPSDMVDGGSEPQISPALHYLIPMVMAFLGWDILGDDVQAERYKAKFTEQLVMRFKGLEDSVGLRKIATRDRP